MNKRFNDVKKTKTRDRSNNEDVTFKKKIINEGMLYLFLCFTIYFSYRNKFGI